ncbi:beta-catenin-like protein 1 [Acyrthosiphon pisum]|uniref:Beta-catenin-like protein 1 n=1 Tax=Acyrthosiphon pisum TaxID=7029 RepID=A0A8R2A3I2_ACYPI|nr:beta-catenin-like protein 1 [Acyrthosiphon pisum]|eukprot:XP_001944048.2 PREDICTED: beta-catenin-like protein 1 [Acyrthosiphon pisum]
MDIGELLDYKPANTPKRPLPEEEVNQIQENETDYERQKKLRRLAKHRVQQIEKQEQERLKAEQERLVEEQRMKQERQDMVQKLVDENLAGTDDGVLDEAALKRMILLFEKKVLKNQEMRIKFPENPEKFMESEIELHDILTEMHAIATVPDLYPVLVNLKAVLSLLELLTHENTDIAVAVVNLLQELTDLDSLNENEEGTEILIDALLSKQICALLVQNLERMDESVKEEANGVHTTLGIFENIMELRPDVVVDVGKQGLIPWLLKRIKAKMPYDGNKLYSSEILSILLQNNEENRALVGEIGGIDNLLQQLAYYKRHDPSSPDEQEMMENLFDCLCSCLMDKQNRDRFLRGEGLQLMNLILREKKLSRNGSLKVLNHALSGPQGKDNCNKFVDILGLRTIFPLFMKTPKKNRKRMLSTEEHEEHVISIIANMLRNCRGTQRQRLMTKFAENDMEKVDRLMELHFKYMEKVEMIDAEIDEKNTGEEDEDEIYLKRLNGGLFSLQLVDYITLEVCNSGPNIKKRVTHILNMRGGTLKTIRQIMREYAGNLGEDGDKEWQEQEQRHILKMVDKL